MFEKTKEYIKNCDSTDLDIAESIRQYRISDEELDEAERRILELEAKAAKWDMIQWAYDNGIPFVWNGESRRVWLEESDFVYLEGRYKERDQSE